jgi:hypothetical protein
VHQPGALHDHLDETFGVLLLGQQEEQSEETEDEKITVQTIAQTGMRCTVRDRSVNIQFASRTGQEPLGVITVC